MVRNQLIDANGLRVLSMKWQRKHTHRQQKCNQGFIFASILRCRETAKSNIASVSLRFPKKQETVEKNTDAAVHPAAFLFSVADSVNASSVATCQPICLIFRFRRLTVLPRGFYGYLARLKPVTDGNCAGDSAEKAEADSCNFHRVHAGRPLSLILHM